MKGVLLDGHTINPGDLSWAPVEELCDEFVVFEKTDAEDIPERIKDCDILGRHVTLLCRNVEQGAGSKEQEKVEEMSPAETRERIVCLCLVFAVVIFFWMAFHQNGLTLTWFADEFTAKSSEGLQSMCFDVWNLVAIIFIVYAGFSFFQSKTTKAK